LKKNGGLGATAILRNNFITPLILEKTQKIVETRWNTRDRDIGPWVPT
jgi:hypothetical protein